MKTQIITTRTGSKMAENLTPMMRQYQRIKSEISDDVLLMFRLGDFYEMFLEDAQIASPILGVALTHRAGSPMCGIPYHALDAYLAKLIRANKKIAICDQMEDPATAKGIVRREVTRIVTPGTVTESSVLRDDRNNYIVALAGTSSGTFGLAALDLSTGELIVETHPNSVSLIDSLRRLAPGEGIAPATEEDGITPEPSRATLMREAGIACITPVDAWFFDESTAHSTLTRHFGVKSLEGFGCEGNPDIVRAAGALLQHVRDNLRRDVSHVKTMRLCQTSGFMALDDATCEHLDLLPDNRRDASVTLYGVLNATRTPMGARLLHHWISRPLQDIEAIRARHEAIEALSKARGILSPLRDLLGEVRDLERTIARISLGRGNARDVQAISTALKTVPQIRAKLAPLAESRSGLLQSLGDSLQALPQLTDAIDRTLVDTPPAALNDGGIIRVGVNPELDELRGAASNGRAWIANYQAEEIARTGIKTLKVKFNNVFGYFIEVSTGQLANVPENYQRKQTIVNGERFTTPELKEREEKITGAAGRAIVMETEIFEALRRDVMAETAAIQLTAAAIAALDVIGSLTDRALALGYVRPIMTEDDSLHLVAGRHPVIEQLPDAERFVPNDTDLNGTTRQIMVITGPNMAGKSTYIRQVAMLVVMAQMGSFIPASSATIGIVDRVFTRVGASDDLSRGRSTFMVEMQETANILNNATPRSLIVLDEIGRGTSTFDGISIAWAVAEYLHDNPKVKAKTLFATHYHELTDLSLTLSGVVNCSVLVREQQDGIVFLRRIVEGAADKSYGIAVAKLAGMPEPVLRRAREILSNLEADELADSGVPSLVEPHAPESTRKRKASDTQQPTLFDL